MGTQHFGDNEIFGAWRSRVAHLLWEQRVACSNHAAHTSRKEARRKTVLARIYQPSKSAMQSGRATSKRGVLEFEPEAPRTVEPLMGWTSSADMRSQILLGFDTREEAVAYAEKHQIPQQVFEPHVRKVRPKYYSDDVRFDGKAPWRQ